MEVAIFIIYVIAISIMLAKLHLRAEDLANEAEDINLDTNRLVWKKVGYNLTLFENRVEEMYAEKQSDHLDDGLPVYIDKEGRYQIW